MQFKQTRVRLLFIFSVPRYMMSWIFLIGAMSFFAAGSLFSQATYLPQGDKSYILLDRLEIKTGKDSAFNFSKTKPFSRQHAVDAVRNLMSQGSGPALSKTDAHNLRSFYLNNLEYIPEEERAQYLSKKPIIKRFYGTPANLYEVHTTDFDMVVNPVIQFTVSKESDNSKLPFCCSIDL